MYNFPHEEPTADDWRTWYRFWLMNTEPGMTLTKPLGAWINPTHRLWNWRWNTDGDALLQKINDTVNVYMPSGGRRRTRSKARYTKVRTGTAEEFKGNTATVIVEREGEVLLVNSGPEMAKGIDRQEGFWNYVRLHEGEWMWENIENETQDLTWLAAGLKDETMVAVTDG